MNSRLYTLFILIALSLNVQSQPLSISVSAGPAFTAGDLGHKSDLGYTGLLSIEFTPDHANSPELKVIARLGVNNFPSHSETDFSIFTGEIGLKFDRMFAQSPNMYLLGTGGLAKTDDGIKETSPVISLGIGIESGPFVIESRLVRVFGARLKETTFVPVTIGVRF